jgi:D-alanyl-D-alanine carboxypeptidase
MPEKITDKFLSQVTEGMTRNRNVYGAALCVENEDKTISWAGASGNINENDRYFIASVTKLCVSMLLLHLREENRLNLDDRIGKFLPGEMLRQLHVMNGVDYTSEITVKHLLANTSGIPDYFSQRLANGKKADVSLFSGNDEAWPRERVVEAVKKIKPKFRPGQKGKVQYCDTNYELLGAIIESVTGKDLPDAFREYIFYKLELNNTYAFKDIADTTPVPMYFKTKQIQLPRYIASITAQGGLVSTSRESMALLKAFFNGRFFPVEYLEELKEWKFIAFPGNFYFGIGLEKLWIPWLYSPLKPIGEILGFWGHSGAFAFHNPDTGLYFTGTVNQLSGWGHSAAVKAMIKIIKAARD